MLEQYKGALTEKRRKLHPKIWATVILSRTLVALGIGAHFTFYIQLRMQENKKHKLFNNWEENVQYSAYILLKYSATRRSRITSCKYFNGQHTKLHLNISFGLDMFVCTLPNQSTRYKGWQQPSPSLQSVYSPMCECLERQDSWRRELQVPGNWEAPLRGGDIQHIRMDRQEGL